MPTLSCRLDEQKFMNAELTVSRWINYDNNSTQNESWLFRDCVHATHEDAIWNDWLHTEVQTCRAREKNSELNDANKKKWDTILVKIWANTEWVNNDRIY